MSSKLSLTFRGLASSDSPSEVWQALTHLQRSGKLSLTFRGLAGSHSPSEVWQALTHLRTRHFKTCEHHVRSDYVFTYIIRIRTYVLKHSNGTVTIKYLNITLFVSALLHRSHELSLPHCFHESGVAPCSDTLIALCSNTSGRELLYWVRVTSK